MDSHVVDVDLRCVLEHAGGGREERVGASGSNVNQICRDDVVSALGAGA